MTQSRSAAKARNGTGSGKKQKLLARPGDPLVTENGELLEAEGYEPNRFKVKPSKYKATKRKSLKELPADAGTINGIACVMVYTLLGLADRDIADALKITTGAVQNVKKHSAYAECFELVSQEFVSSNSELIQARLAAYSHEALSGVYEIATQGSKENNRLKANMSLLDRAGFSPREQMAKIGMSKQELRITVVEGETHVNVSHTFNGE